MAIANVVKQVLDHKDQIKCLLMKLEMLQQQMVEQPLQYNQKMNILQLNYCRIKKQELTEHQLLFQQLNYFTDLPIQLFLDINQAATVKYIQLHFIHKIIEDDTDILILLKLLLKVTESHNFAKLAIDTVRVIKTENLDLIQVKYSIKSINIIKSIIIIDGNKIQECILIKQLNCKWEFKY
ncbi:unnamed protein product [Paramecium sonneborni]|uniref:Uncharacterized protein n=1 Tax=Paramecium sonneborni TaxID=65129 RepID=A0A8S1RQ97_9CILI|nr:unnamed protein product [Paramecium sonneborni]